ncbi:MAG: metallophosphoesterase [Luteimonas sp.]
MRSTLHPLVLGLGIGLLATAGTVGAAGLTRVEPNTLVPAGVMRYAPSVFPDRIVASPAQDAATGFSVAWRTALPVDASPIVDAMVVEIVLAGDSPDMGPRRRIVARSTSLEGENGAAQFHRAEVDGLQPDTLYAWRVQGGGTWSPWMQTRTAAAADAPLTLLYFGDTQNKNASLSTRVLREAHRHAPDAKLALFAGDLVSGGDGEDDNEWGEWFDAVGPLATMVVNAPAPGNHEYWEEFEDTPQERRVLGGHWSRTFALPANGAPGAEKTSYWFDYQGVRVVVLDGTSALDLGTAEAQAAWLDRTLAANPHPWSIALIHQPMYSPRQDRDNVALREQVLPVLERRRVDLVLQGHDHVYGRRPGEDAKRATPQYLVSVVGAKQYRLSDDARRDMAPTAEDTQLFQVIRLDGDTLHYESRTATGRLYDAFEIRGATPETRTLHEITEGRIAPRDCARDETLKGRADRCWE